MRRNVSSFHPATLLVVMMLLLLLLLPLSSGGAFAPRRLTAAATRTTTSSGAAAAALLWCSSSPTTTTTTTTAAAAAANAGSILDATDVQDHFSVLDGAEWQSLQRHLQQQQPSFPTNNNINNINNNRAVMHVVTARLPDRRRLVGLRVVPDNTTMNSSSKSRDDDDTDVWLSLRLTDQIAVYADSVAFIPDAVVSLADAVATYQNAWSVHCVMMMAAKQDANHVLTHIGGSAETTFEVAHADDNNKNEQQHPHVLVLGGNHPHAVTSARALAALGCRVTVVTTTNTQALQQQLTVSGTNKNTTTTTTVNVVPPADENGVGFCETLSYNNNNQDDNTLDAVLDTVGNELEDNSNNDFAMSCRVLELFARRHDCHVYLSTQTAQEQLMLQNGLLWGPQKAKDYLASFGDARNPQTKKNDWVYATPPPPLLGRTVQTLLDAGVLWSAKKATKVPLVDVPQSSSQFSPASATVRGWTWGAYWEATMWPRDVSSNNVRFGLPLLDNNDDDEEDEEIPLLSGTSDSQVEAPPLCVDVLVDLSAAAT